MSEIRFGECAICGGNFAVCKGFHPEKRNEQKEAWREKFDKLQFGERDEMAGCCCIMANKDEIKSLFSSIISEKEKIIQEQLKVIFNRNQDLNAQAYQIISLKQELADLKKRNEELENEIALSAIHDLTKK